MGSSVNGGGREAVERREGVRGAGEFDEGPASDSADTDSSCGSSEGEARATDRYSSRLSKALSIGIPGGDMTADSAVGTALPATAIGRAEDLLFGDVCALLAGVLCLESALSPRAIDAPVVPFRFSFSTLRGAGLIGDGVGRGKVALLLSGTSPLTLTARTAVGAVGTRPMATRPAPTFLPHPAEFGSAAKKYWSERWLLRPKDKTHNR